MKGKVIFRRFFQFAFIVGILMVLMISPVWGFDKETSGNPILAPVNNTVLQESYITIDPIGDQYLGERGFFINGTTSMNSTEHISVDIYRWPPLTSPKLIPGEFGGALFNEVTILNSTNNGNQWYVFINTSEYNSSLSEEWLVLAYNPYLDLPPTNVNFKLLKGPRPVVLSTVLPNETTPLPPANIRKEAIAPIPTQSPDTIVTAFLAISLLGFGMNRKRK